MTFIISHSLTVTYMGRTVREALQLCQPQERNISNKIFGGFLMRKAFELAFVTGYLHARTQPFFHGLDGMPLLAFACFPSAVNSVRHV